MLERESRSLEEITLALSEDEKEFILYVIGLSLGYEAEEPITHIAPIEKPVLQNWYMSMTANEQYIVRHTLTNWKNNK